MLKYFNQIHPEIARQLESSGELDDITLQSILDIAIEYKSAALSETK